MKIAILSDVHGNLPALRRCLQAIATEGCDRLFCLGDIFGYYPDGEACLDLLMDSGAELLMGNHEAMLLGILPCSAEKDIVYRLKTPKNTLSDRARHIIEGLLPYKALEFEDGTRLLLVHGTPWDPLLGYAYPDGELGRFAALPFKAVFMGHTHRPFASQASSVLAVNVGSCGLPRDIGNQAAFVIYEVFAGLVKTVRVAFDRHETLATYPLVHDCVKQCLSRNI
jgi:predicted phosphodiesterase